MTKDQLILGKTFLRGFILGALLVMIISRLSSADGKQVYEVNCLECHGANGDGMGPAGKYMQPHPRDFTKGRFQFGSTKPELMKTVKNGIAGTAMPGFPNLLETELSAVVEYILRFKK